MEHQNDEDFFKVVKWGFLVPYDVNEEKIRDVAYIEHISDNRLHLVIHTTKGCNFRCTYCYMDFETIYMDDDIQKGVINYIKKNIQKYKGIQISWFGGEPLLGMSVIENISHQVIEICRKQKKPYSAIMTTNGYNLTEENINQLIRFLLVLYCFMYSSDYYQPSAY